MFDTITFSWYYRYMVSEEMEPEGGLNIGSLQEGVEWISRLEKEQMLLEIDLFTLEDQLSGVGAGAIAFALDKTKSVIEEIKLEMMMIDE